MLIKKESLKNEVKNSKNPKTESPDHSAETTQLAKTPSQQLANRTYTQQPTKNYDEHQSHDRLDNTDRQDKKMNQKTRITIKYDAGFPNQLYIRGKGANLSWDKGQLLKNVKADEWIWETDTHFNQCEFKILINDRVYENGDNHRLNAGSCLLYTPHF